MGKLKLKPMDAAKFIAWCKGHGILDRELKGATSESIQRLVMRWREDTSNLVPPKNKGRVKIRWDDPTPPLTRQGESK